MGSANQRHIVCFTQRHEHDLNVGDILRSPEQEEALRQKVSQVFHPCWAEVFTRVDENKDGYLSLEEITAAMVASAPTRPPQDVAEDAERCMREYDLNSDNK